MPEVARGRSGWRDGCQSLKSPMTETASAFGAQTAKRVPSMPFGDAEVGAELVGEAEVRPFVEEVQVLVW